MCGINYVFTWVKRWKECQLCLKEETPYYTFIMHHKTIVYASDLQYIFTLHECKKKQALFKWVPGHYSTKIINISNQH